MAFGDISAVIETLNPLGSTAEPHLPTYAITSICLSEATETTPAMILVVGLDGTVSGTKDYLKAWTVNVDYDGTNITLIDSAYIYDQGANQYFGDVRQDFYDPADSIPGKAVRVADGVFMCQYAERTGAEETWGIVTFSVNETTGAVATDNVIDYYDVQDWDGYILRLGTPYDLGGDNFLVSWVLVTGGSSCQPYFKQISVSSSGSISGAKATQTGPTATSSSTPISPIREVYSGIVIFGWVDTAYTYSLDTDDGSMAAIDSAALSTFTIASDLLELSYPSGHDHIFIFCGKGSNTFGIRSIGCDDAGTLSAQIDAGSVNSSNNLYANAVCVGRDDSTSKNYFVSSSSGANLSYDYASWSVTDAGVISSVLSSGNRWGTYAREVYYGSCRFYYDSTNEVHYIFTASCRTSANSPYWYPLVHTLSIDGPELPEAEPSYTVPYDVNLYSRVFSVQMEETEDEIY